MDQFDDKLWVIWCVTAIALCAMFAMDTPESIINAAISGLFGVAVGKSIGEKK